MNKDQLNQRYTDLLSERLGGCALACSDEWFAPAANLVKHAEPIFREGYFVETGQWMDGWESRRSFRRRSREASGLDHDWCVLALGAPGMLRAVNIATTHFRGNAPEYGGLDGCYIQGEPDPATEWRTLLAKSPVEAHSDNLFALDSSEACTHLRLKMYPDGGIARLRAWGDIQVDTSRFAAGEDIDLASVLAGGRGQQCSDMFYSSPSNLLMPYAGINMGDGWETRRRRDAGHDWCIVRLGVPGNIRRVVIDTAHFKGNYPDHFTLEGADCAANDALSAGASWQTLIGPSDLEAHREHTFIQQLQCDSNQRFTHVRLNIFPDGGISRLRIFGRPNWVGSA